jgi:hypothetical protein
MTQSVPSTGLSSLDEVLQGLLPGDNVVWQVESVEDYRGFVLPYCDRASKAGHEVVYFRFAKHPPILPPEEVSETVELQPEAGFETFIAGVHATLSRGGPRTCYVFDCLSDLAVDWFSDQMLGNFFMLTCPFVLRIRALAYFGLLRNAHSPHALGPIADTTQILLDVFRFRGSLFVRPLKVEHRHSPTMYTLHTFREGHFHPVTDSHAIAEVMAGTPRVRLESAGHHLDIWSRTIMLAEEAVDRERAGAEPRGDDAALFPGLLRMLFSRDERVLALARRHLALPNLVAIARRMIGTGLIGGKSAGMLLARAILRGSDAAWDATLEPHDSFFIGSDVFYTFLVRNDLWHVRDRQKDDATMLEGAEEARRRVLAGTFPDYIVAALSDMLDYYGQSPIIVRSSSLLEDNFGNAFSGKYDSVFCANQGLREERMAEFLAAVRAIYASTMSERALSYRAQRGILDRDEQMAILVQRVSGSLHGGLFYPEAAGVGYSFNPYVWHRDIDPKAGMLRIVFGMGTRAVDRTDDDYTRIVALNAPGRRPEAGLGEVRRFAQRRVDYLNLAARRFESSDFSEVATASPGLALHRVASRDPDLDRMNRERRGAGVSPYVLTFDGLFDDTTVIPLMRRMLGTIEQAYGVPVDIEFTANFTAEGEPRINLVQCRPMPAAGEGSVGAAPPEVDPERVILRTGGPVIGTSRTTPLGRVILVRAEAYDLLTIQQRHSVARLIGRLTRLGPEGGGILLIGPGRWGTTTPNLGVPVSFAEIAPVTALCEVVAMREGLVPDVSLGTHFFNDLVEAGMLYLACFPKAADTLLNTALLARAPNRLAELLPADAPKSDVVLVADARDLGGGITLHADAVAQRALCWVG